MIGYTVDDVINAYEKGCAEGFSVQIGKISKKIKANLASVLKPVMGFYSMIDLEQSKGKIMLLRISGINTFEFIIAIDEKVFYNDEVCKPIYLNSFEISKEHKNVNLSFMPLGENINLEALNSDNFILLNENA